MQNSGDARESNVPSRSNSRAIVVSRLHWIVLQEYWKNAYPTGITDPRLFKFVNGSAQEDFCTIGADNIVTGGAIDQRKGYESEHIPFAI